MDTVLVNSNGRNLWAEAAIAFNASSDAKIASRLNRSSQQIGKFRREGKYPTEKFLSECRKALCLTTLPSEIRGGWLYEAIRNHFVDKCFGETCEVKIAKSLQRLDEAAPYLVKIHDYLQHLKATIWIISDHPDGLYHRLKKAEKIHLKLQRETDDLYLRAASNSQLINIRYFLSKYFDGDQKSLTQKQAQDLLVSSYEVASVLNNLPSAINLAELASVANSKKFLDYAYEKIRTQVDSKYLANAVEHHLATRDGATFRMTNPLKLK